MPMQIVVRLCVGTTVFVYLDLSCEGVVLWKYPYPQKEKS